MKLNRVEFADVANALPASRRLLEAAVGDLDLLFSPLGFEPRCIGVAQSLVEAGVKVGSSVMLTYSSNAADNSHNHSALNTLLNALGPVKEMNCDSSQLRPQIKEECRRLGAVPRVGFDISVASNKLIMRALSALLNCSIDLTIFYAEANLYFPSKSEYENSKTASSTVAILSEGVGDLDYDDMHLGPSPLRGPECVVLFPPGFDRDRSRKVLSKIDPELLRYPGGRVVWIVGDPAHIPDKWRLYAMREVNGLNEDPPSLEHSVSTFDYKATMRILEWLYEERFQTQRITISPMGSKMQAVGSALFCLTHQEVRSVFATPARYNAAHYSQGIRDRWVLELGNTSKLRALLSSIGDLVVEPPQSWHKTESGVGEVST